MGLNLTFAMYYLGVKPHMGGQIKYYVEFHNEWIIIILTYHMFVFTNFVPKNDFTAIYTMGHSFILWIAEILFINIFIMFYKLSLT